MICRSPAKEGGSGRRLHLEKRKKTCRSPDDLGGRRGEKRGRGGGAPKRKEEMHRQAQPRSVKRGGKHDKITREKEKKNPKRKRKKSIPADIKRGEA